MRNKILAGFILIVTLAACGQAPSIPSARIGDAGANGTNGASGKNGTNGTNGTDNRIVSEMNCEVVIPPATPSTNPNGGISQGFGNSVYAQKIKYSRIVTSSGDFWASVSVDRQLSNASFARWFSAGEDVTGPINLQFGELFSYTIAWDGKVGLTLEFRSVIPNYDQTSHPNAEHDFVTYPSACEVVK